MVPGRRLELSPLHHPTDRGVDGESTPPPTTLAFSDTERADFLAQHLATTLAVNSDPAFEETFFREVNTEVNGDRENNMAVVSEFEVEAHLKRCRNGKAPGWTASLRSC